MKKIYIVFIILVLAISNTAIAQHTNATIKFAKGDFVPPIENNIEKLNKEKLATAFFNNQYFVVLQFTKMPTVEDKIALLKIGVQLESYLPNNAFYATLKGVLDFKEFHSFNISSINTIPAFYKIAETINEYSPSKNKTSNSLFAIQFCKSISKETISTSLKNIGAAIVPSTFSTNDVIYIQPNKNIIQEVAALPFVISLSAISTEAHTLNYEDAGIHATSSLQTTTGRNLQGRNVTLGAGDNSDVSSHLDFVERRVVRVAVPPANHGTHTAGTMSGAGLINPIHKGVAPKSTFINQYFTDIITQTPVYVNDFNLIATNNSYTTSNNGCSGNSLYDASSNFVDNQLNNYKEVLHVFASGNDGSLGCTPYSSGFATIKSGWQVAKNVLTVGNLNGSNFLIGSTSSKGPVKDGRIKPEIVANGTNKVSTFINNTYASTGGTSMAAPVVTGVAGLLVEKYRQLNGNNNPKAALLKAVMCNTADDLGNVGPDYTFGFGVLNARRAIETIETNRYFTNNNNNSFPITVPTGARRLKVMLYWADAAGTVGASSALVNDIDLTVTGAAGLHLPLILDASAVGVNNVAIEGADHLNNIEQVVIDNPIAGTYNLNVNMFNIPVGPQEYFVTYQIDMNGVTVEYPYGGETLVPGETETILWSANGDEASTYKIEYSDNNGSTWVDIAASAAANTRLINWTVPTTPTNDGRIRVTKNTSGNSDISDYKFSILAVPTLSSTVPCEGYVDLNWTSVIGATNYDILQLKGDSMSVIATASSNNFLVEGLNSSTKYWFAVRAKNGSNVGRKSIAQSVTPTSGICTLSNFDNNFKAVSLDAPMSGRKFTSSALTATEQIKFTIKNLDDVASTGTYNLYYQINASPAVMESSAISILALSSVQYTFTTTANFLTAGVYNIKAWVKKAGDVLLKDDTTFITIKQLDNLPLTLPFTDGFETTTNANYEKNTIGLEGDDRVDFKTNSIRGRARTFVNTGFAASGTKAITLDQTPIGALVTDSLLMTFNASAYNTGNQLRIDFDYKNHGQAYNPDNKVWIRGSDVNPWVLAYDLAANQAGLGEWKKAFINVNNVLDTVVPAQAITSSFQIKFGQQGNTSANLSAATQDLDDGYTFDDVKFSEALNDVELLTLLAPNNGCGAAGLQTVQIKLKNYSSTTLTNVPLKYRINNGIAVSDVIPSLAAGTTTNFSFATPINFANNTDYNIDVWVDATTDNYRKNDSLLKYNIHTSPIIATFPYLEGFESNDGNFYASGKNSSWQIGTPSKTVIQNAANGTKAWVTNLTGDYNNLEQSYLYSPCFNLSSLTNPILSFSHIFKTEENYDFHWVDYTTDGGKNWIRLGTNNDFSIPTNWYNPLNSSLKVWDSTRARWHVSSHPIPTNATAVKFRFAFTADEGVTDEGVGIDDIHIFDKNAIYVGANTAAVPQMISGTNWIDLKSASGEKIASINPQGNNLGTTNASVYFNTAVVRFTPAPNSQYYLDRNIVITPTTAPASPVLVRFYFTDAETNALIKATGCAICSKISTAYAAGITKYSGTAAEENGNFEDDITGVKQFILPSNVLVIPYDKGYYAEFAVSSFSEFWINSGGVNANQPLPINILSFTATKQNTQVKLDWQTNNEKDNTTFIIERSNNGRTFEPIGNLISNNVSGINSYSFIDILPSMPISFYRIKLIDANQKITYTDIRKINFDKNGIDISIYPNPVNDGIVKIISSENCSKAILFDATGKTISTYILQGRNNKINIQGISKGMYQLQVFVGNESSIQKIIIE
jgi:hypothetical protein